jgi:hypothetical protein
MDMEQDSINCVLDYEYSAVQQELHFTLKSDIEHLLADAATDTLTIVKNESMDSNTASKFCFGTVMEALLSNLDKINPSIPVSVHSITRWEPGAVQCKISLKTGDDIPELIVSIVAIPRTSETEIIIKAI